MNAPTTLKTLELPGGRRLRIRAPAEPERLLDAIDAAAFSDDERMPYWAETWPAGLAFAARLLAGGPPALEGRRVLELGSGLGIVGIAAALAGAALVTFSDWFGESLEIARENAALNSVEPARVATLLLDWRAPPAGVSFDTIIGSDLLYESRNIASVIACTRALLAEGGTAWIADPDRLTAGDFAGRAEAAGFHVTRTSLSGCAPRGWVYEMRRGLP